MNPTPDLIRKYAAERPELRHLADPAKLWIWIEVKHRDWEPDADGAIDRSVTVMPCPICPSFRSVPADATRPPHIRAHAPVWIDRMRVMNALGRGWDVHVGACERCNAVLWHSRPIAWKEGETELGIITHDDLLVFSDWLTGVAEVADREGWAAAADFVRRFLAVRALPEWEASDVGPAVCKRCGRARNEHRNARWCPEVVSDLPTQGERDAASSHHRRSAPT